MGGMPEIPVLSLRESQNRTAVLVRAHSHAKAMWSTTARVSLEGLPAPPGCCSQGETEEAGANIIEAIQDYQAAVMAAYIKDSRNAAPDQTRSS